jgi:hypothetical protein
VRTLRIIGRPSGPSPLSRMSVPLTVNLFTVILRVRHKNIPTAEYKSVMQNEEQRPIRFPPVTGAGNRLH